MIYLITFIFRGIIILLKCIATFLSCVIAWILVILTILMWDIHYILIFKELILYIWETNNKLTFKD